MSELAFHMTKGMEAEAQRLFRRPPLALYTAADHLKCAAAYTQSAADNWRDHTASASQVAIYAYAAGLHLEAAGLMLFAHWGD